MKKKRNQKTSLNRFLKKIKKFFCRHKMREILEVNTKTGMVSTSKQVCKKCSKIEKFDKKILYNYDSINGGNF